ASRSSSYLYLLRSTPAQPRRLVAVCLPCFLALLFFLAFELRFFTQVALPRFLTERWFLLQRAFGLRAEALPEPAIASEAVPGAPGEPEDLAWQASPMQGGAAGGGSG